MSMFSIISSQRHAGSGCGLLKGVEVHDHHVDRARYHAPQPPDMLLGRRAVKQAAVDDRVQGFDAAIEHLGKAGEVGDIADGEAGLAQSLAVPPVETSSTSKAAQGPRANRLQAPSCR